MAGSPLPDPGTGLLREVLDRHGWRCCVCGRPCRKDDVWRHSGAGLAGDRPDNFSAMCEGCRLMAMGRGAAPARYVVRVSEPGLAWRRVQVVLANGLVATVLVVYGTLAVFAAVAMWHAPRTAQNAAYGAVAGVVLTLALAIVVRGLLERWRWRTGARATERTVEKEALR